MPPKCGVIFSIVGSRYSLAAFSVIVRPKPRTCDFRRFESALGVKDVTASKIEPTSLLKSSILFASSSAILRMLSSGPSGVLPRY